MQNRQGASMLQPYRDLWKLFHKDEVISKHASWIFRIVPFALFTITLVLATGIPVFTTIGVFQPTSDVLVAVYLIAFGSFLIALAGMDTASSFGGFGSSREMTVAALTEGGLLFSLIAAVVVAKTTSFVGIVERVSSLPLIDWLPLAIAAVAFFIALLAETARMPFDNPATHLELTMIHEAMILEYSGKRLALIEWAAANKLLLFAVLAANLFFPWGVATSLSFGSLLIALLLVIAKVFVILVVIAMLESSIAKLRFFRLPDLLMASFVLGIIAIAITII